MKLKIVIPLLAILFCSCNGQISKKEIQKKDITKNSVNVKKSFKSTTNSGLPYLQNTIRDPLFYIEGQLCQHLRKIFQDSKGNLWFGTNVYGIMRFDGEKLEYFNEKDGVVGGRITAILEDNNGNVWFGSGGGLIKFDGTSFRSYTEKDGLHNTEIWTVFLDEEETFWIGTTYGVSKFDGVKFTKFPIEKASVKNPETIFSFDRITHILKDNVGNMWFGTDGYGISIYDGKEFNFFTKENGLCDNNIAELMLDSQGNIWIGSYFGGISKYDGKTFKNFTKEGIIEGVETGAFFEEDNGSIWFAAENEGVYKFDGMTFTKYNEKQGLNTKGVLSILKDKEERFWFGGWGGLFRYKDTSFNSVTNNGPWDK